MLRVVTLIKLNEMCSQHIRKRTEPESYICLIRELKFGVVKVVTTRALLVGKGEPGWRRWRDLTTGANDFPTSTCTGVNLVRQSQPAAPDALAGRDIDRLSRLHVFS